MDDEVGRSLRQRIARLAGATEAMPPGRFAGRGIVICAGGARVFTSAYVLISVLRNTLGCRLPIEVWHFGPEEISPAMAALLTELEADPVDATRFIAGRGAQILDGWQLKPFALQWSRFAEVLMLDADQVPVADPAGLFDWPEYRKTGAVFWPDIADLKADNPVWEMVGLSGERVPSIESGQVLVDKRRHWHALSVVVGLNEEAEALYRLIYGDKDTFLLGWRLAGATCALVPHRPFTDERLLVQRDFAGRPLFQHRTNAKWIYFGDQYSIPGFVHEAACLEALATLRARWGGRVAAPPPRTLAARAVERELVGASPIRLTVAGEEAGPIELLAHGEVGQGRAYDLRNWYVAEDTEPAAASRFTLVFRDGDRTTYRFSPTGDGRWMGRRLSFPEVEAVVAPRRQAHVGEDDRSATPGLVDDLLRAAGFPASDPATDDTLGDTLALLDGVEPGVAARLRRLASERRDRTPAARLERLAARIAEAPRETNRTPDIGPGIFAMDYSFSLGKPD
jgi:hypothetical protein